MVERVAALGRRDDRRGARGARRGRRRQPGRRHPPRLRRQGSGYCVFNDVAVAARLMQAEWHRRQRGALLRVAVDRPRRAPGQRHRGDLPRRPDASSRCRCTARRTSRSARRRATSTSSCPTAAATPPTSPALDARAGDAVATRTRDGLPGLVVLPGRRRPARGRPARPAQAHRRRPGRARPARVRGAARRARIPVALAMAGGYGRDIDDTVAIQVARPALAHRALAGCEACAGAGWQQSARMTSDREPAAAAAPRRLPPLQRRHDPLDGQRRLRPRQQRRLLQPASTRRSTRYLIEAGALDIHARRR